jgi:hypothetical protein
MRELWVDGSMVVTWWQLDVVEVMRKLELQAPS